MKIAFIADPLDHFKIYKDSTYAMMREAHRRGHVLYVLLQEDLSWRDGAVTGDVQSLQMTGEKGAWYKLGASRRVRWTQGLLGCWFCLPTGLLANVRC